MGKVRKFTLKVREATGLREPGANLEELGATQTEPDGLSLRAEVVEPCLTISNNHHNCTPHTYVYTSLTYIYVSIP